MLSHQLIVLFKYALIMFCTILPSLTLHQQSGVHYVGFTMPVWGALHRVYHSGVCYVCQSGVRYIGFAMPVWGALQGVT